MSKEPETLDISLQLTGLSRVGTSSSNSVSPKGSKKNSIRV
jgi:hypothetical protein